MSHHRPPRDHWDGRHPDRRPPHHRHEHHSEHHRSHQRRPHNPPRPPRHHNPPHAPGPPHNRPHPVPPHRPPGMPTFRPRDTDHGPTPFVTDINRATNHNENFRSALWSGRHLQVTLMSIPPGGDIGAEIHPDTDQFLRIEEGEALVLMGRKQDQMDFRQTAFDDFAILIPAGHWHNVVNLGNRPLKLYSIYAPPHHPHGTVHPTREAAERAERR